MFGIAADHHGARVNIRARKAVIIATGGSTGNVNFRRMFDPRLTEEYCGLAGMPWSDQDASGEIAAMAVGAALWGLFNYTGEFGSGITKPGAIGCQYGYVNVRWHPGSEVFDKARAIGLQVTDWQDVILVNMLGKRFYDETAGHFNYNTYQSTNPYEPYSYLNAKNAKYNPSNFINAALAGIGDGHNGGGPIWAIFDADAVAREKWNPNPPHVDFDAGFFFSRGKRRRTRREDQNEISARADAAAKSRRYGRALQFIRRCRQGCRLRQAEAALQDREAAVLRRLGDAGHPRHPRRLAHQCALPGGRYERRCRSPAFIAAANRPAAFPCTACRAPSARASSPARTPPKETHSDRNS